MMIVSDSGAWTTDKFPFSLFSSLKLIALIPDAKVVSAFWATGGRFV